MMLFEPSGGHNLGHDWPQTQRAHLGHGCVNRWRDTGAHHPGHHPVQGMVS